MYSAKAFVLLLVVGFALATTILGKDPKTWGPPIGGAKRDGRFLGLFGGIGFGYGGYGYPSYGGYYGGYGGYGYPSYGGHYWG